MLLIGSVGSHLTTLCRLALHIADIDIFSIDTSKQNSFFDGLRSAIRVTGSEGKVLSVMLTARDLADPMYLDAINSLLISGEYAHIFSNDELDGLLQVRENLNPGPIGLQPIALPLSYIPNCVAEKLRAVNDFINNQTSF